MSEIIGFKEVEGKVLELRDQHVILDRDVAELYGVETREINQAVKNNPDKFPEGYILALASDEWDSLRSKNLILNTTPGRGRQRIKKSVFISRARAEAKTDFFICLRKERC
ncbi:ORF6N domain-containing protein [Synergistaceae bacterium OttesenSCG-928-I11]|nr:ORF6N domain-containing protein [Synergistaceae bacterium OttesenSCG-928-I11]